MKNLGHTDVKLSFISVNRNTGIKFFNRTYNPEAINSYYNPEGGVVIDRDIVREDEYEFFLVPHKNNLYLPSPVKFHMLYTNEEDLNVKDLYETCYRL